MGNLYKCKGALQVFKQILGLIFYKISVETRSLTLKLYQKECLSPSSDFQKF